MQPCLLIAVHLEALADLAPASPVRRHPLLGAFSVHFSRTLPVPAALASVAGMMVVVDYCHALAA